MKVLLPPESGDRTALTPHVLGIDLSHFIRSEQNRKEIRCAVKGNLPETHSGKL